MNDSIKVYVVQLKGRTNYMMQYRDPVTAKWVSKSSGNKATGLQRDRRKAEKKAAQWESELQSGRYQKASRVSWADFRDEYEREHLAHLSERTAETAGSALNHFERVINPKMLASVTTEIISRFRNQLISEGMRDTTLMGHLRHLKAALSWAVRTNKLHAMPAFILTGRQRKKAGKQRKARARAITGEEFERMILATPKIRKRDAPKWQRLLKGLWLSGLRLGESLALSWDDDAPICIDLAGDFPRMRISAEAQKSNEDGVYPLTPDFAEFLLKTPEDEREGLVFGICGPGGKPLSTKRASRNISDIGEVAGVVVNKADGKFASAHDLRRSFGTRWSKQQMPAVLMKLMRHADIGTTMGFYVDQQADEIAADLWSKHQAGELSNTFSDTLSEEGHPKERAAKKKTRISAGK